MRLSILSFILLLPIAAHAAGAKCEHPVKPTFPDPKTADPAVVEKLADRMEKYSASVTAYAQCLTAEAQSAQQEGAATITAYNDKFLAEYNKRATK